MNVATDLLERAHQEITEAITAFEARPHRSRALHLCRLADRTGRMERAVLHPVVGEIDGERAGTLDAAFEARAAQIESVEHATNRAEMRSETTTLAGDLTAHMTQIDGELAPMLEDRLGVARMNEIGIALLDWGHAEDHRLREQDEDLNELLELTRDELYEKAQEVDLDGRSRMKKAELAEALAAR